MESFADKNSSTDTNVYIRAVSVVDLPADIQEQAEGRETLYSVHRADGAPVALVANRRMAEELARDNNLIPHSVH